MTDNTKLEDLEPIVLNLKQLNRKDLAFAILDTFYKVSKTYNEFDNLAKCYFKLKDYEKASECGEFTLAASKTNQEMYTARSNLINIYNHANYPEKALFLINQCKHVIEKDIDIILEEAYSEFLLNNKTKAEGILTDVLLNWENLTEEYVTKIKFNLGTYFLYRDEFQKGLRLFLEEGAKMKFWNTESIFARNNNLDLETISGKLRAQKFKAWDGIPRPGKTIIVHAEAGIGDEIINVRFMRNLIDMGMNAYWYNSYPERSNILDVFNRQGFKSIKHLSEIKEEGEIYYAQSMHLPITMNLKYEDLWKGAYIKSDPEYFDKWKEKLSGTKPKIAIRWQGSPMYDQDLHRSVPLKDIYEAVKHIDADFYSIQRDDGLEELSNFPGITDLSSEMKSWEDTFAILDNMDYVISSCTSVAHASASLGKNTLILIPISAYYVWSHSMEQSPWYGENVKLLRQERPRVWGEPLEKLTNFLNTVYYK